MIGHSSSPSTVRVTAPKTRALTAAANDASTWPSTKGFGSLHPQRGGTRRGRQMAKQNWGLDTRHPHRSGGLLTAGFRLDERKTGGHIDRRYKGSRTTTVIYFAAIDDVTAFAASTEGILKEKRSMHVVFMVLFAFQTRGGPPRRPPVS